MSSADAVLRLELALLEPATRSDPELVSGLLDEEFVEFGASGRTWDRASIIASLAASPGAAAAEVLDLRATPLGPDAYLVTYRARTAERASLRSSVWVRADDGAWRLRFHQGTVAPE